MRAIPIAIGLVAGCLPGLWIACSSTTSTSGDAGDAGDATADSRRDSALKDAGAGDDATTQDANRSCIPGMIAWWKGDNDTTDKLGVIPLSVLGNKYDASGTIAYRPAEVGNGFYFDVSGGWPGVGHLEGDASPALDGLPALTIEGWISGPPGGYPGGTIVARAGWGQDSGYGFAVSLGMTDAGVTTAIELWINTMTTALDPLNFDWSGLTHLAVTYHPNTGAVFYINGSKRLPAISHTGPIGDAPIVSVGGNLYGPFSGIIDELSIYNVDLTAQQIQDIVAAGPKGKCP